MGGVTKSQYRGKDCKNYLKREPRQFVDFEG